MWVSTQYHKNFYPIQIFVVKKILEEHIQGFRRSNQVYRNYLILTQVFSREFLSGMSIGAE